MASTFVESSPALNRLFRDISLKFSPVESEDVVKSSKRIYGEQFNSLDNQDLLSCLNLLYKLGYVSNTKLTLVKEFVASKSNKEKDISDTIDNFKDSLPPQADPEKELQGRSDDFKNIRKRLETGQPPVVNLYGSAGVGKTTLAKEICAKWRGKAYVFDLREAKDTRAIYLNILNTLELSVPVGQLSLNNVVDKIHEHIGEESKSKRVLFLLDNVEQFTAGEGKEGKNLKTAFMMFLGKLSQLDDNSKVKGLSIHVLLTSRTQLHHVEKVSDYELEPLKDSSSEKILLSKETSDLSTQQKEKLLAACKGKPLLLKGMEAILMQGRKAPSDLVDELDKLMASKEKAAALPVQSKSVEDAKEKAFDLEKGVDEDETSVIEEMFNTLPSDSLKAAAVSISLFCGPFTASTAAKVLNISHPEAVAQLEGLVTSAIIFVVNREAKELMYDIHPLLRKYAGSIKDDAKFTESYTRAKERFYDHFMSKMKRIAGYIESDYVKAFNLFSNDRPNYEFTIEIALLPEFFSVPGEFHENALIASLVNAMLSSAKQTELFHSWADMCEDDAKSGMIFFLTNTII